RYDEFMRITRLWRHLKMLKRSGVTYFSGSVRNAPEGSCAIICPACPSSTDWEDNETINWAKSTKFLMLDANFRLKCKIRSTVNDKPLGSGLAYYVSIDKFKNFLGTTSHCNQAEEAPMYCDSNLHAVDHANLKGNSKYVASGVGAVQCRHMFVQPNGTGDLSRGESYHTMDYLFWSSFQGKLPPRTVVSYDIACRWSVNQLRRRLSLFPPELQFYNSQQHSIEYVIPKFHIYGHGEECQTKFSLNYRPWMARVDGENIERGWSWMNPAALGTREMGLGARQDHLDD
ncbi:uncharacterized protein FOMMEDRAFT_67821, partial [Fomitiporia mediterranea MF3/22]